MCLSKHGLLGPLRHLVISSLFSPANTVYTSVSWWVLINELIILNHTLIQDLFLKQSFPSLKQRMLIYLTLLLLLTYSTHPNSIFTYDYYHYVSNTHTIQNKQKKEYLKNKFISSRQQRQSHSKHKIKVHSSSHVTTFPVQALIFFYILLLFKQWGSSVHDHKNRKSRD